MRSSRPRPPASCSMRWECRANMHIWQWVVLGLIVLAIIGMVLAWSLCVVSGDADDDFEM